MQLLYLLLGIAGLVLAAHLVITGVLHIADRLKLSHVFVGLTVLALGTNLPEIVVSITGAIHNRIGVQASGVVVGDAIGSCFGQLALTLGILGLLTVGGLYIKKRVLKRDGIALLITIVLLIVVSVDGALNLVDGVILLATYGIYLWYISRSEEIYEKINGGWVKPHMVWATLSVLAGFGILAYCSTVVIKNAVALSNSWGVAQSLVGILIVGIGTSLPELTVALIALKKRALGLSVGNIIGSNIVDMTVTPGIGAAISTLTFSKSLVYFDVLFLLAVTVITLVMFRSDRKITRWEAATLIGLFALYAVLKLVGF